MLNKKALAAARIASGTTTDADFEYVTMLLHGDGTNGAQNNTFIDGSTNNFTVTRNGNVTQGSLNPFGDRWSNYFDGNGDFLQTPTNSALACNSTNYTFEAWAYLDMGTYSTFDLAGRAIGSDYLTNVEGRWLVVVNSSGKLEFGEQNSVGQSNVTVTDSVNFPLAQWVHIAAVKSGTTMYLFKNGVLVNTATSAVRTQFAGRINIGQATVDTNYRAYWLGYISNARLLKGTALYTANFTPPTAPLTAITNTSLLTCQSNRFIDNSSNNFTFTRNGDVSVRPFSPFSPSAAYSTSTNGGSGYFDGTGDYLSIADDPAFDFGTGDFTIEAWVYCTALSSSTYSTIAGVWASGFQMAFLFSLRSTDILLALGNNSTFGVTVVRSVTIPTFQWLHVAASRSGTSLRLFLNGQQIGATETSTQNLTAGATLDIGRNKDGNTQFLTGYMSNLRIVKGTAVYTANFTPPTAPLTAITNTSLLLNFTNGGIIDNAADNVLETVGNAQISTSVKKYGTGSLAFNGSNAYLTSPSSSDLAFGTGPYTVEFWIYFNAIANWNEFIATSNDTTVGRWCIYYNSGSISVVRTGGGGATAYAWTPSTGQWYHFAATRDSSSVQRLFVDGVLVASATSTNDYSQNGFRLGYTPYSNAPFLNGYIDDLRITKGVARYTANFTPPTAAFPDL